MSDEFKDARYPVFSLLLNCGLFQQNDYDKIITDILKREKIHQLASKLGVASLFCH